MVHDDKKLGDAMWCRATVRADLGRVLLIGAVLLATACSSRGGEKKPHAKRRQSVVLAQVGPLQVTNRHLAKRIEGFSPTLRARYSRDVTLLRQVLLDLVDEAVLLAEARKNGELRNARITPEVYRRLRRRFEARIFRQLANYKPSAEEERAYYDKHRSRFAMALRLKVREIVVATKEKAEKLVAEVKAIDPDPHTRKGPSFEELAKRQSIDPLSKYRGGHLEAFSKPTVDVPEPVFRAALALTKRWQVSPPVKTSKGWHIIQLVVRQDARQRTLEEARPSILVILRQLRGESLIKAALEGMRTTFKAKVFPERVVALEPAEEAKK